MKPSEKKMNNHSSFFQPEINKLTNPSYNFNAETRSDRKKEVLPRV